MAKKVLDTLGFSALINIIKNIKNTSETNTSDVSTLQDNLQTLTSTMLDTLEQVDNSLSTLDNIKQDKANKVNCVIPITGWNTDNTPTYPAYYDIEAVGVTNLDTTTICLAVSSITSAVDCGLCPISETLTDTIRIRAIQTPTEPITIEYYIQKGVV